MRSQRNFTGFFCFFVCLNVFAADPFDHSQRQMAENPTNVAQENTTACQFDEPAFATETPFEQLTLVGVVLYKQAPEAFFLDGQKQLILAKQGFRLGQEGYLLQQIGKEGVKFLRPKAGQCEQTEVVERHF